jgi:hypothetical protein
MTRPQNCMSAGDEKEIYAELVAGLGEAIVSGMVPGTSLCFTARKDDLGNPQVTLPVSTRLYTFAGLELSSW